MSAKAVRWIKRRTLALTVRAGRRDHHGHLRVVIVEIPDTGYAVFEDAGIWETLGEAKAQAAEITQAWARECGK